MASRLTEANYLSRKVKLNEALTAARLAADDEAFKIEMGEATDDDVRRARDEVANLEARIVGLDAAWRRTLQERGAQLQQQDISARHALADTLDEIFQQREGYAGEIQTALDVIVDRLRLLTETGEHIHSLATSEARRLGRTQPHRSIFNLNGNDSPKPFNTRIAIARVLEAAGIDLRTAFRFQLPHVAPHYLTEFRLQDEYARIHTSGRIRPADDEAEAPEMEAA